MQKVSYLELIQSFLAFEYANLNFQPLECGWEGFVSSRSHTKDEKSFEEQNMFIHTLLSVHKVILGFWGTRLEGKGAYFPFLLIHYWQPFVIQSIFSRIINQHKKDSLWLHPFRQEICRPSILHGNIANPFFILCTCWFK